MNPWIFGSVYLILGIGTLLAFGDPADLEETKWQDLVIALIFAIAWPIFLVLGVVALTLKCLIRLSHKLHRRHD